MAYINEVGKMKWPRKDDALTWRWHVSASHENEVVSLPMRIDDHQDRVFW